MGSSPAHITAITPRVSEVNGAQHIGASVIPVWLEHAAVDCFQQAIGELVPCTRFAPSMRKSEIDYLKEVFYPDTAEITTLVTHVGNSSVVLEQEIVQRGAIVCTARAVWVNTAAGASTPIPGDVAAQLNAP